LIDGLRTTLIAGIGRARPRIETLGKRPETAFAARLTVPHAIEFNHQHLHGAPSPRKPGRSSEDVMKPEVASTVVDLRQPHFYAERGTGVAMA